MSDKSYLGCAETAKLVRVALKREFPGVKFSVKSSVYSGGASINIDWLDGPTTSAVDKIGKQFAGGRFDGMIDMAYSVEHWLLPDGTAIIAKSPGSSSSMGMDAPIPEQPMPEGARRVSFGADYVFTSRRHSATALKAALDRVSATWVDVPAVEIKDNGRYAYLSGNHHIAAAGRNLDELVYAELRQ
jgi:hypothetical protein